MSRQYYEVLGLSRNASPEEIKQAYRALAKQWHPDRFPHDPQKRQEAEAKFKEISVAYEILKNSLGKEPAVTTSSETFDKRSYAEAFYRKGTEFAEKGQYQDAIKEFSNAISFDADFLEAYQYRGFVLSKLGFENRAKADFFKVESLKKQQNHHSQSRQTEPKSTLSWIKLQATICYFKAITTVVIDKQGKLLVYGSHDNTIQVWHLKNNQIIATLQDSHPVYCLILSADAKTVISGGFDRKIWIWNMQTQEREVLGKKQTWHEGKVLALALSANGKTLISGSSDKTVKIWSLQSRADPYTLTGYAGEITSIAISPNGQYFVAGGLEPHLRIRNVETGKLIRSIKGNSSVLSVAFSPDSELLATGGFDRTIRLWHVKTGKEIWTFTGHLDRVSSVLFTPDGQTLISASWDQTIKFWSLATKEELGTLNEHTDKVLSLALSADGKTLVSGSSDRTLKIWQNTLC